MEAQEFTHLAQLHLRTLYAAACRLAGRQEAEDLIQETLTRAYRSRHTLSDSSKARQWLITILTNAYYDACRKASRRVQETLEEEIEDFSLFEVIAEEDPFPYSDELHSDFLALFSDHDIKEVLERLPCQYRTPLVLSCLFELHYEEIAQALDCPKGTVMSRLHRARKLMERELWNIACEKHLVNRPEKVLPERILP